MSTNQWFTMSSKSKKIDEHGYNNIIIDFKTIKQVSEDYITHICEDFVQKSIFVLELQVLVLNAVEPIIFYYFSTIMCSIVLGNLLDSFKSITILLDPCLSIFFDFEDIVNHSGLFTFVHRFAPP